MRNKMIIIYLIMLLVFISFVSAYTFYENIDYSSLDDYDNFTRPNNSSFGVTEGASNTWINYDAGNDITDMYGKYDGGADPAELAGATYSGVIVYAFKHNQTDATINGGITYGGNPVNNDLGINILQIEGPTISGRFRTCGATDTGVLPNANTDYLIKIFNNISVNKFMINISYLANGTQVAFTDCGVKAGANNGGWGGYHWSGSTVVGFDNWMVWDYELYGWSPPKITDSTPPTYNVINCTSNPDGDITEVYNSTGDKTPTFKITFSEGLASAGISDTNNSFSACTVNGNEAICTLPYEKSIDCGTGQTVYFNATDSAGNSAYANGEVWACEATKIGDKINVWQSVMLYNFNNTHLFWNRSICVANFYEYNKSFAINSLFINGWTLQHGTNPISVQGQSINCTTYTNITVRPMYDELIDIISVGITSNQTGTFTIGNLIDPPHAFIKDGLADCSLNTTVSSPIDINVTFRPFNTGIFNIKSYMKVDAMDKNDTKCKVDIHENGTLDIT